MKISTVLTEKRNGDIEQNIELNIVLKGILYASEKEITYQNYIFSGEYKVLTMAYDELRNEISITFKNNIMPQSIKQTIDIQLSNLLKDLKAMDISRYDDNVKESHKTLVADIESFLVN